MLRVLPLGGCGEIGMNMTVIEVDGRYYFIDCGALFPDAGLPGVDLIIPDVEYLIKAGIKPDAWLITHGHEDHIGALPWIYHRFPAPLYASPFTRELIREKFKGRNLAPMAIELWTPNVTRDFANISVTPYTVNHSIPDALGFIIETPYGNIVHTGDFRIDPTPTQGVPTDDYLVDALQGKPALILMSDSTNSMSPGQEVSETKLIAPFEEIIRKTPGAVVATTFASNVERLANLIDVAVSCGRRVHLAGRSIRRNVEIARNLGLAKLPPEDAFVAEDRLSYVAKKDLFILCTGSQGEPTSGLSRLVTRATGGFGFAPGDTLVFSSRIIPGNERNIVNISNLAARKGAKVITPRDASVHASGHAFRDDLKQVLLLTQPRYFMPVHGEYRHLTEHIKLAIECGVKPDNCCLVEDGAFLRVDDDFGISEQVESGRDYICEGGIQLSSQSSVFKTRMKLALSGIATAVFVVNGRYELISDPDMTTAGVPVDSKGYVKDLIQLYNDEHTAMVRKKDFDEEKLRENLRLGIRRLLERKLNYKCMTSVMLKKI